ncbi:MAG: hypothetical protein SGI83_12105 [Bacteroidota bacterium]|nr:hypothetical protein [Bacteroidota bacterium]
MNKDYILYNLQNAKEQLDSIIKDIKTNSSYHIGEYMPDISHLYHHINTSWNARDSTEADSYLCKEEDFFRWRQFPEDIYLGE